MFNKHPDGYPSVVSQGRPEVELKPILETQPWGKEEVGVPVFASAETDEFETSHDAPVVWLNPTDEEHPSGYVDAVLG